MNMFRFVLNNFPQLMTFESTVVFKVEIGGNCRGDFYLFVYINICPELYSM